MPSFPVIPFVISVKDHLGMINGIKFHTGRSLPVAGWSETPLRSSLLGGQCTSKTRVTLFAKVEELIKDWGNKK